MKTTIRMDASTKYFIDDVSQIERSHLRGHVSSYAHKTEAYHDVEMSGNHSMKVYIALKRTRFGSKN